MRGKAYAGIQIHPRVQFVRVHSSCLRLQSKPSDMDFLADMIRIDMSDGDLLVRNSHVSRGGVFESGLFLSIFHHSTPHYHSPRRYTPHFRVYSLDVVSNLVFCRRRQHIHHICVWSCYLLWSWGRYIPEFQYPFLDVARVDCS
jgi:hypothetical protein